MGIAIAASIAAAMGVFQAGEATWKSLRHDTEDAARESRSLQEKFERNYRRILPPSKSFEYRCEIKVGRFCYWYDPVDTTFPPEPASLKSRRRELLAALAAARSQVPASDWLIAQRVRYLIEDGSPDLAATEARGCGATRWWCHALKGWSEHAARRFPEAEIAFDSALVQMPAALRCLWSDWSVILDGAVYKRFHKLDCQGRERLMDSLFYLADPLWLFEGNDLRTEMLSRRVMAAVFTVSKNPFSVAWGDDLEELLLRYGWFTGWSEAPLAYSPSSDRYVMGHGKAPGFDLLPSVMEDGIPLWKEWDEDLEVRTRYGPMYLARSVPFASTQVARFRRGDTTVIAAAGLAAVPREERKSVILGLAAGSGPGMPIITATRTQSGVASGLLVRAQRPNMVSLEAWTPDSATVACYRTMIDELPERRISDVLFFATGDELPNDLPNAVERMVATTTFPLADPVGIYWELSNPIRDSARIEVAIARTDRSSLRKLSERLRLARKSEVTLIEWTVRGSRNEISGYAAEISFAQLKPGPYLLSVTMTVDGNPLTTNREFEIKAK